MSLIVIVIIVQALSSTLGTLPSNTLSGINWPER